MKRVFHFRRIWNFVKSYIQWNNSVLVNNLESLVGVTSWEIRFDVLFLFNTNIVHNYVIFT